jgi:hypothetical protein
MTTTTHPRERAEHSSAEGDGGDGHDTPAALPLPDHPPAPAAEPEYELP